jgi:hypothetical protein
MAATCLLFQEIVSRTGFHFSKPSPISEFRILRIPGPALGIGTNTGTGGDFVKTGTVTDATPGS